MEHSLIEEGVNNEPLSALHCCHRCRRCKYRKTAAAHGMKRPAAVIAYIAMLQRKRQ